MRGKTAITVTAEIGISDETAERCCRLLEMWFDDNADADMVVTKVPDKDQWKTKIHIERNVHEDQT